MTPRPNRAAARPALTLLAVVLVLAACQPHRTSAAGKSQATSPSPPRPPGTAAQPLLPVAHWRSLFDETEPGTSADDERLSQSHDSVDFYDLAYTLDGLGSMFEATGDFSYVRPAFRYVTNMMNSAQPSVTLPDSSFKDGFLGWASAANNDDETPLFESYAWRYVTRLLRLVQPALAHASADIQREFDRILSFTETNIVGKWLTRGANAYIYRSRTHMAAHWAMIALDLSRLTAKPDLRASCLQIVANMDDHLPNYPSSLHAQVRPNPRDPAAAWWSDEWGSTDGPGQDVAHGNGVVAYMVESHDLDGSWSANDMARLSRTLTEVLLRSDGSHPEYLDGSGKGNGWLSDGFVKLGRFDAAVQAALESYSVQNAQYYAAMAANARILGTG